MSRNTRAAVLVASLMAVFGALSSTAGAVTWHNTGATSFHATGGPGTLSVGSNNFACTASTATGTAPASAVGTVYSASGTLTYSPCTLAGQNTYIHCGYTMTGVSWANGTPAQTIGVADVSCVLRVSSTNSALCNITGTTPITYLNPSGTAAGRLTLTTSGTGLTVSHASGTSCLLGTGTAHLSEQTITVTSVAGSPVLTRTA